jgi:hypothetical protein
VTGSNKTGTTRLTETQARALADWWGGKYHQIISPDCPGNTCHGVIFEARGGKNLGTAASCQPAIFSLEEAQTLEKARGPDNPGAKDWVG